MSVPRTTALIKQLREEIKPMDSFGASMHAINRLEDHAAELEQENVALREALDSMALQLKSLLFVLNPPPNDNGRRDISAPQGGV